MKRGLLYFAPMALAAVVFAQGTEDATALVKKLGSEDYVVREEAQKQLVEMGDKAVPALEEALKSEDLEVRLRAGRALRAIGGGAKDAEEQAPPPVRHQIVPGSKSRGFSITMGQGKVTVTITEMVDGKPETKTYEGASLEELKEKHPELKEQLGGTMQFQFGARDNFDMDKFWTDWDRNFDSFDEDLRKWQEETRREFEGMRRWMDQVRPQPQGGPDGAAAVPGTMLGVQASRPTAVLDAQLGLEGRGIVVEGVRKGSLGERLCLQRFDVLLDLNGREIRTPEDVAAALREAPEGTTPSAKVIRRAKPLVLEAPK
jgi:hypothetical protein